MSGGHLSIWETKAVVQIEASVSIARPRRRKAPQALTGFLTERLKGSGGGFEAIDFGQLRAIEGGESDCTVGPGRGGRSMSLRSFRF